MLQSMESRATEQKYFLTVWPLDKGWENLKDGQVVKQLKRWKRYTSLSLPGKEANLVSL